MQHVEFESLSKLDDHLSAGRPLTHTVFQSLNLLEHTARLQRRSLHGAVFLGCEMAPALLDHAISSGALVFPRLNGLPFDPYRPRLYTPNELLGAYRPGHPDSYAETLDGRIYHYFMENGGAQSINLIDALAQRLHDHAITDALEECIDGRRVVAMMGGHGMRRDAEAYLTVARIARTLTQRGFLMASGGGPGAMEATHLGTWFAKRTDDELADAVQMLAKAPYYKPISAWMDAAFAVKAKYPLPPDAPDSLGIPTWHYGHEPPNAFATRIAKYFANSVREDGLLAIATYGVIFSPGSAGTIQEIFQDAAQNHYETVGHASPMVFFGKDYWTHEKPVYPLLKTLARDHTYGDWLTLTDDVEEVVDAITRFALSVPG